MAERTHKYGQNIKETEAAKILETNDPEEKAFNIDLKYDFTIEMKAVTEEKALSLAKEFVEKNDLTKKLEHVIDKNGLTCVKSTEKTELKK